MFPLGRSSVLILKKKKMRIENYIFKTDLFVSEVELAKNETFILWKQDLAYEDNFYIFYDKIFTYKILKKLQQSAGIWQILII